MNERDETRYCIFGDRKQEMPAGDQDRLPM